MKSSLSESERFQVGLAKVEIPGRDSWKLRLSRSAQTEIGACSQFNVLGSAHEEFGV